MRHPLRTALLFGVVGLFLSAPVYAEDSTISSVTVESDSTEVSATGVTYTVDVTVGTAISSLGCVLFEDTNPQDTPFIGTSASIETTDPALSTATQTLFDSSADSQTLLGAQFVMSTGSIAPAVHSFSLVGVENPSRDGTFQMGCTSGEMNEEADFTYSDEIIIGDGEGVDNPIDSLEWEAESMVASATTQYTFTVVTNESVQAGTVLTFFLQKGMDSEPAESGVQFTDAAMTSATVSGALSLPDGQNDAVIQVVLDSDVSAGTHQLVFHEVKNPSAREDFRAAVSVTAEAEDYVFTDSFITLVMLSAPAKASLKVKKKGATAATLKWGAVSGADTYTVQLRKCKNPTKKGCQEAGDFQKKAKYKKYSNLSSTKKRVKKLGSTTFYQWRVKSCLTDSCSGYSSWSRFRTK